MHSIKDIIMSMRSCSSLRNLGILSMGWIGLHSFAAEYDLIITRLLGEGKRSRKIFALIYFVMSVVMYILMANMYSSLYKAAEKGDLDVTFFQSLPAIHFLERANVQKALTIISSLIKYTSVFIVILANFSCTTTPESRCFLLHDGIFGTRPRFQPTQSVSPESVSPHGIGRVTRHPINVAMFLLAFSHLFPIAPGKTWEVNIWFWLPQLLLACLSAKLHDRQLQREPKGLYKRYLKETTSVPSISGFVKMPESEIEALVTPGLLAATITSGFWKISKLNKIMQPPMSVWLPLAMLSMEVLLASVQMCQCSVFHKKKEVPNTGQEQRAPSSTTTR